MIGLDTSMADMIFMVFINVRYYIMCLASAVCVGRTTEMTDYLCCGILLCIFMRMIYSCQFMTHEMSHWVKYIIPCIICQLLLAVICIHKWKHVIS